MDKLEEICDYKRELVESLKKQTSPEEMRELALAAEPCRGFEKTLREKESLGQFGLIAEIKKASPSKGVIRKDFDVASIAKAYEAGGASALSVLTDEKYFQGANENVKIAKQACNLPVLRKDFIIDEYQIYEAKAIGADAILLIAACLEEVQAKELEWLATELGMDVLIEVHDRKEMMQALTMKTRMLGVNNRDLKTLEVNLKTSVELSRMIPGSYLRVCESGIFHQKDMLAMRSHWYNTFLVGESLMAQGDVQLATKRLLEGY